MLDAQTTYRAKIAKYRVEQDAKAAPSKQDQVERKRFDANLDDTIRDIEQSIDVLKYHSDWGAMS
jgi:hypothetical protein